ncbi:unnamed protein product [Phyllotreta striolata]|uniref:C2H2-type domain-containing protein n=1 Tax=Phyllotreta striolata TaxID=444603 RepID=A0A9N9XSQ2_PHYSR|nr:unnamed protein product [Phyllotreta striolata]
MKFNFNRIVFFLGQSKRLFFCRTCSKCYKHSSSRSKHERYECQKEPQFQCVFCDYKTKLPFDLRKHERNKHKEDLRIQEAKMLEPKIEY